MVPQRGKEEEEKNPARSAGSKTAPRDGRQEGRGESTTERQSKSEAPGVSGRARQGAETQGRDWWWVEAGVWNERMLAALGNGVRGGKRFSLIDKVYRPQTLRAAWQRVKANAGAAGVDGVSVKQIEAGAQKYLGELEQALKRGEYQPQPVRRVEISKGNGKKRPLGIPVVKDRIVQTAIKLVIEPIFEHEFEPSSHGFRPQRSCKDALREVDELIKQGYCQVVDADIDGCFDNLPREPLLAEVGKRISDGLVLELIDAYLKQDIIDEMKRWKPTSGTPQ